MWWPWILGVLAVWTVVGLGLAVVIGRGIRLADERSPDTGVSAPLTTADLPAAFAPARVRQPAGGSARRGPVPLPPVGIALVVVVLALETAGFASRLTGATGTLSVVLSMDAPFSVPRLFVAALFAVAALAAVAGAGAQPGRRTWWLAVAAVAAGIAVVKAGSTLHAEVMGATGRLVGDTAAHAASAVLAAGVVAALYWLSRGERRDRRRVLGALSGYAVAVVGLSAVSSLVPGGRWAAAATFVEESGEGIAGVAFLVAVLVGVAPELVLPRAWVLRRRADAEAPVTATRRPLPGSGAARS